MFFSSSKLDEKGQYSTTSIKIPPLPVCCLAVWLAGANGEVGFCKCAFAAKTTIFTILQLIMGVTHIPSVYNYLVFFAN